MKSLTAEKAIAHCRSLAAQNRLDPEAVEIFLGNMTLSGFKALNRFTGKTEPIRNEQHLERLLLVFCRAQEHQTN